MASATQSASQTGFPSPVNLRSKPGGARDRDRGGSQTQNKPAAGKPAAGKGGAGITQSQRKAWFEQVYAEHYAVVFGFLRARLLTQADSEDLTQEVFLRFYNGMDRYDPERADDVRPWLRGISRNVLREQIRRLKRRSEVGWTEFCLELDALVGGDTDEDERLSLLPTCIERLGESSRHAIESHYMGGKKMAQIAEEMGRTVGAVKVLMVRSRQALRRCVHQALQRHNQEGHKRKGAEG